MNYLGSMLSQKCVKIPIETLIRCLALILQYYEEAQAKQATNNDKSQQ